MADYYSFLNYIAFVILYIICLYFVSQDFSEIIGFYILFIIHTASTIFIGKDIVNVFSGGSISNPASMISILLLGVVMAGLSCNFVSLILIMLMLSNLQTKFDASRGTPLRLPDKYRNELNEFKLNLINTFIISLIILLCYYFGYSIVNVDLVSLFKNFSRDEVIKLLPGIVLLGISYLIIHYSIRQVNIATSLSKLRHRQLLNRPGEIKN
jgi:hypothetical protein